MPLGAWKDLLARASRARIAVMALLLAAPTLGWSCSADFPPFGDEGRSASIAFSNAKMPFGKHVDWAPRDATIVLNAGFRDETHEYAHGIMGALSDRKTLVTSMQITGADDNKFSCPLGIALPNCVVFEDIAPRFADLDRDGAPEILVVASRRNLGAQLVVYDRHASFVAATPPIGTHHRWLAPIGAADLDGDGKVEIAYIDRPHLAKTLRIWRFEDGELSQAASVGGFTNHRIGEDFITGGIRDCGSGPEMLVVDANWSQIMAVTFDGKTFESKQIARFESAAQVQDLLSCP